MTKKRAWQTLSWMSAFFLINQIFFQGQQISFLTDQKESFLYSGIYLSIAEVFPVIQIEDNQITVSKLIEQLGNHLKEEVFPTVDYCQKYWKNTAEFLEDSEEIPEYFLETDEEKAWLEKQDFSNSAEDAYTG